MDDLQTNYYEMFMRTDNFGAEHSTDFPEPSLGGQKFGSLRALIAELEQHSTAQSSSKSAARASTGMKRGAKKDLRQKMVAVSDTARVIDLSIPGTAANFRMPTTNGDQALLSAARAFVEKATPLKDEFTKREMPADFLDDLRGAISAFEATLDSKNVNTEKRVTATAAIDTLVERGRTIVRELDAIVRNKYRNDPATLAGWESATHVERPAKRKKVAGTPTPTT
ncbi:MAG: hypothetical protein DMF68_11265 [Acidobacteria bacterium]|nr:MAG: hypothetical protein DMF68_11265 [Acidobacteriota bacterium]